MIKRTDPLRRKIAELTSTNNYYDTKGEVMHLADKVLESSGLVTGACELHNDAGRTLVPILNAETDAEVAQIAYSWYRMPSGRYEANLYIT
jgi:hypothetical protein